MTATILRPDFTKLRNAEHQARWLGPLFDRKPRTGPATVHFLRPEETAYDLYVRGSTLDDDPATFSLAEKFYRQAITLNPKLAVAWVNLGNLRFNQDDHAGAETHYRMAIMHDEKCPEAHYNLGYLRAEEDRVQEAIALFRRALACDPKFADAHFNLAMALVRMGHRPAAKKHWAAYLKLEPSSVHADTARLEIRK